MINHLNQAGLDTVRATGGNNFRRFMVLATHAGYYSHAVRVRGMLPIWWDNGYPDVNQFGLIDRAA